MDLPYRITLTCFAASYAVAFFIELTRFVFRVRLRAIITIGMTIAGLFAHTIYLFAQSRIDLESGVPLSSWDSWCLAGSWLLVGAALLNLLRAPETATGLIFYPLSLALILAAFFLHDVGSFSSAEAKSFWRLVHGMSLLAGTVSVSIGFVAGLLFLVESWRLKHKRVIQLRFSIPSLERLQKVCERTLIVSAFLLGLGVLSGIVINLAEQDDPEAVVQWGAPVVWTSMMMFAWSVAAVCFIAFYKPARHGKKVAYLVLASFLFLIMSLVSAFVAPHGGNRENHASLFPHRESLAEKGLGR